MTEAEALDALLADVGIFIWYPGPDRPTDPPSGITEIDLGDTDVSDEDLLLLRHFPHLEWLCLEDASITDYGLSSLTYMTSLQCVELYRTNVTEEGIARLRKALPHCRIEW